jgi:hypothetical protein
MGAWVWGGWELLPNGQGLAWDAPETVTVSFVCDVGPVSAVISDLLRFPQHGHICARFVLGV